MLELVYPVCFFDWTIELSIYLYSVQFVGRYCLFLQTRLSTSPCSSVNCPFGDIHCLEQDTSNFRRTLLIMRFKVNFKNTIYQQIYGTSKLTGQYLRMFTEFQKLIHQFMIIKSICSKDSKLRHPTFLFTQKSSRVTSYNEEFSIWHPKISQSRCQQKKSTILTFGYRLRLIFYSTLLSGLQRRALY